MNKFLFSSLLVIQTSVAHLFVANNKVEAQVTTDNTVNTQVEQNGSVAEITGGETRGSNLFHSFREFSVGTGNEAFFNNANDIANIFSRVTGGNISNIDGLIRANGSASLFLINPAGIVFGEGARLDIGGSFYGSSASSILFEGGEFSAVDLDNPPLLTVNAPIGLGFRDNPENITNRANFGLTEETFVRDDTDVEVSRITEITGLEVSRGENFALIGGDISLEGSGITAPGGNVTLGGLSEAGTVTINADGSFEFADNVAKADLSLIDNAVVDVTSGGGGFINVDVGNLTLDGQSRLYAGIAEGMGSPDAVGGDIVINASDTVRLIGSGEFENPNRIDLETSIVNLQGLSSVRLNGESSTAQGDIGSIIVSTDRLELNERGLIRGRIYGTGNSGAVNVTANTISLDKGAISSDLFDPGVGNSGDITVNANSLDLTNSFILADNFGTGNVGNVTVNVIEDLTLKDLSIIFSQVQFGAEGDAGDVTINADNLQLVDSLILADSRGQGNAGNITINVNNNFSLENNDDRPLASEIVTGIGIESGNEERDGDLANLDAVGDAGTINIQTGTLTIEDGSQIFASTNDVGDSGDISIQAEDAIAITNGGQIASQVGQGGVGDGGEINLTAPAVSLDEFSVITTNTEVGGRGIAGNIMFNTDNLRIANASIIDARTENEFDGGNITVNAETVDLLNGGKIITVTNSTGNSGEIVLNSDRNLNISGSDPNFDVRIAELAAVEAEEINDSDFSRPPQFRFVTSADTLSSLGASSGLFANTTPNSGGNAGSIQIFTPAKVSLSDLGTISVEANGDGGAGTIVVAAEALDLNNGSLSASTQSGSGGNINLTIENTLSLNNNSSIAASAFNDANGGNLAINSGFIIAFPNGSNDILASAQQGQGGNIRIDAESLLGIAEGDLSDLTNDINASSEFSLDGNITINTLEIDPLQGTTELPTNVINSAQVTAQTCQNNGSTTATNSLSLKGKGGIPPAPDLPLDSQTISLNSSNVDSNPPGIETSQGTIQPARGIRVTKSGQISLTAYPTDNAGNRLSNHLTNCDRI